MKSKNTLWTKKKKIMKKKNKNQWNIIDFFKYKNKARFINTLNIKNRKNEII